MSNKIPNSTVSRVVFLFSIVKIKIIGRLFTYIELECNL